MECQVNDCTGNVKIVGERYIGISEMQINK